MARSSHLAFEMIIDSMPVDSAWATIHVMLNFIVMSMLSLLYICIHCFCINNEVIKL